ncbi:MAG TPA: serine hydrolase domain-containing protein [Fimbriimonadales bacterium]|nr:serine hydrolase domain-containing protein [Fimbriimonadales bacterium]
MSELLKPIRNKYNIPALAAAFVRGNDVVSIGAVGVRKSESKEPIQIDDCFQIGSCTKSMTATMIARLVEQGKLSWESKISDVFPEAKAKIHNKFKNVTLRQLLTHRSGLPDDRRPDSVIFPQLRTWKEPLPKQRKKLLELLLNREPAYEPGTKMEYSNYGYVIAGAMAEKVTGKSWEELMKKLLFEPLGMKTAGFGPPGLSSPENVAWGHLGENCEPIKPSPLADNPPVIGPAGTVHCSISDWAKYAILHLRGARGEKGLLLKPETFRILHGFDNGEAMGWIVGDRDWAGGKTLAHAGSNTLWFAVIWIAPRKNAAFLAVTNCGSENSIRACDETISEMIKSYIREYPHKWTVPKYILFQEIIYICFQKNLMMHFTN